MTSNQFEIEPLNEKSEGIISNLIHTGLEPYEEAGSVLASTFRRVAKLKETYTQDGACYFVVKDPQAQKYIGGAGLGPLAGLPVSEGIGEIRDLIIDKTYRQRGLGFQLLTHVMREAQKLGYQRLYLETTPQMENAQKLFKRVGFRPVTQGPSKAREEQTKALPCYFLLEDLKSVNLSESQ